MTNSAPRNDVFFQCVEHEVRMAARIAKALGAAMIETPDSETEAVLIAKGYSLREIHAHLPAALVIVQEFGRRR